MSKLVRIISGEMRFSKMLSLELSEIGVNTVSDNTEIDGDDELFTVIDLDTTDVEAISKLLGGSAVIGYTKNSDKLSASAYELCSKILIRPFLISELLAIFGQVKVVKHLSKTKPQETQKKTDVLTVDENDSVAIFGDMRIPLSDNECRVLSLLCRSRGELVERERIYSLLGADDGNMGDVYICHLRRKIDNKLGLKLIYTIRGKGYMLKN